MTERDGASEITPQMDTFQGKLERDSRVKVDHMQPSYAVASSEQTRPQASKNKPSKTPSNAQTYDRMMAVPNLSSPVSVAKSQSPTSKANSATTVDALDSGWSTPAEEVIESDRSSICRSPSWDTTEGKKRQKTRREAKQKLKREEQRAAMEAKKQRSQNRLTKPPPPSKGILKISSSMIASESAPILSGSSTSANSKTEDGTCSDVASRGYLAGKSAKTLEDVTIPQHVNGGFIGGVKLEQATYTTLQETIGQQKASRKSKFAEDFSATDQHRGMSGNIRGGHSSVPERVQNNNIAYGQDTSSSMVLKKDAGSVHESAADNPSLEGKNRKGRRGWPSISSTTFQQAPISLPQTIAGPETSRAPESSSVSRAKDSGSHSSSKPSPFSSRPPVSYREPPQLAEIEQRGRSSRGSFSFLRIRQSSKDRSATESQAKARASDASSVTSNERPRPRRMSWSFGRNSKASSRPTTADSSNEPSSESIEHGSSSARHSTKALPLDDLESVAKAGFRGRFHFPNPTPTSTNQLSSDKPLTAEATHSTLDPHLTAKLSQIRTASSSKELSIQRHESPRNEDYSMDRTSSGKCHSGKSTGGQQLTMINTNRSKESSLQSASRNGQSSSRSSLALRSNNEYYSVADKPSRASTSAPSIQKTERSHSIAINGIASKAQATSRSNRHVDAANQAIGTAIQGNENAKRGLPRINTSSVNPSSSSKPQDLDFLPALKHQSLPRLVIGKGNNNNIHNKPSPRLAQNSAASLSNPPSLTPPESSSSASSSPPSPSNPNNPPAQYLQTARQNLPPPASASRASLAASPSTPGKNTIAKMFVVCCRCRYFHDMPSKIYECMAKPDDVVRDQALGVSGVVSTHVKCPWCDHGMSKACCEGWAAVVVMRERLH